MSKNNRLKVETELQKSMVNNMRLRGLAIGTQESYLAGVKNVTRHFKREPDQISDEDLKEYLICMLDEKGYSQSTVRLTVNGVRDLFRHTLKRESEVIESFRIQQNSKLPVVLTVDEMKHLLSCFTTLHTFTFFTLVYSCGLRKSEAINVQIQDIEGKGQPQKRIKIRNGKGGKDRYIPLPEYTYRLLQSYWLTHQNKRWIFPAPGRSNTQQPYATEPVSGDSMRQALKRAKKRAGLTKEGICIHTFRHSYATHLLEAGVDIRKVQLFLGHNNLSSTMIYLHITSIGNDEAIKRINSVMSGFHRQNGGDHNDEK